VRGSTIYRGQREAEAPGTQWPASMLGLEDAVTQSEEGGIYD
jgi:hypothetical protein